MSERVGQSDTGSRGPRRPVAWVGALMVAGMLIWASAGSAVAPPGPALAPAAVHFLIQWGGAGSQPGTFRGPDGVAIDDRGDVYVADTGNNRVEKFDPLGHFLAALGRHGGDGTPGKSDGEFTAPRGVAVDGQGDLYVADTGNNRIEKFDPSGRFLARWGRAGGDGSAGKGSGEFDDPRGLATDLGGDLYVADHGNNRVQKLSPAGAFLARWGRNGGDGSAGHGPGEFHEPRGVALDRAGNVYVADKLNNRVQKLTPQGAVVAIWGRNGGNGSAGNAPGEFRIPYSVAIDGSGDVLVADTGNNRLQELAPSGAVVGRWGRNGGDGSAGAGPGEFNGPYGTALDCRGGVYVADERNQRVQRLGAGLTPTPACPPQLTVGRLSHRADRRGVGLSVGCDHPCSALIHVHLRSGRHRLHGFTTSLALPASTTGTQVTLGSRRGPRLLRLARRRGPLAIRVLVTADGFAGRAQPVARRARVHA